MPNPTKPPPDSAPDPNWSPDGEFDDLEIDVGDDYEWSVATSPNIRGRQHPLPPDESVFDPAPSVVSRRLQHLMNDFQDDKLEMAERQRAADEIGELHKPKLARGIQPHEGLFRLLRRELVLSLYARHGPGSHADVLRLADSIGIGRSWVTKWRKGLPAELLEDSQNSGMVVTYGNTGLQKSTPLTLDECALRFSAIKRSERREAPARFEL